MKILNHIILSLALTLSLASCHKSNELFKYREGFSVDVPKLADRGIYNMGFGKFATARSYFQAALKFDPTNCQLNFLNALSYQIEGGKGNLKQLSTAEAGYQIAIRFCPADPWSHYYYGLLLSRMKKYNQAQKQFELAVRYKGNKDRQRFLDAYLVSSFNNGSYEVATSLIRKINNIDPDDKYSKMIQKRIKNLMIQRPKFKKSENKGIYEQVSKKKKALPHIKKQLLVDAVIILSQESTSSNVGINLLNGLQLTYSLSEAFSRVNPNNIFNFMDATNKKFGFPTTPTMNTLPFKSVVTNSITTSSINYSLNIFNQGSEKDEILARPSLLVEDGGKASYFSGNQLILGIQGTQTGTITEKNIGVKLEVSPTFNKDNSIELNVNVARTFLRPATSETTFEQTAETIKQSTQTKVNLHFGETVILSALTESLQTDALDETPLLGRIPLVKYLFGSRVKNKINNNVLILLTPRPYVSIDTNIYNERIEKQLNKVYHNLVDPGTNTFRILSSTQTLRSIYRPITLTESLYDPDFLKYATDQEYQMLTEELQ